jgi:hypothetical protein
MYFLTKILKKSVESSKKKFSKQFNKIPFSESSEAEFGSSITLTLFLKN